MTKAYRPRIEELFTNVPENTATDLEASLHSWHLPGKSTDSHLARLIHDAVGNAYRVTSNRTGIIGFYGHEYEVQPAAGGAAIANIKIKPAIRAWREGYPLAVLGRVVLVEVQGAPANIKTALENRLTEYADYYGRVTR